MSDTALSRIPVEIWRDIIWKYVEDLDIFILDPYNGPPARFFQAAHAKRRRMEPFDEFSKEILKVRLVCRNWDACGLQIADRIVSLQLRIDGLPPTERANRILAFKHAYYITKHYLGMTCACKWTEKCQECVKTVNESIHLSNLLDLTGGVLLAQKMHQMDSGFLEACLSRRNPCPNLRSLTLRLGSSAIRLLTHPVDISNRLSSLLYMDLVILDNGLAAIATSLHLPNLRSLDITFNIESGYSNSTIENWNLPSLTSLNVVTYAMNHGSTFAGVVPMGKQVVCLRLFVRIQRSLEGKAFPWSKFPKLVALDCPMQVVLNNPPPDSHPLQYLRYEHQDIVEEDDIRDIYWTMKERPQSRGIAGHFNWEHLFDRDFNQDLPLHEEHTFRGRRFLGEKALMSLAPLFEDSGRRFEDCNGLSYSEAKSRYG